MKIQKLIRSVGIIILAAGMSANIAQAATYSDVNAGDWYYNSVQYVSDNQIMTGLNETTFGVSEDLARAQFATILYRMAGKPVPTAPSTFIDVAEGEWYSDAVAWASAAKIVTGYTDTNTFAPGKSITREEIATMMHRFAKYEQKESDARAVLTEYPDAGAVNQFAYEAVQWSVAHELIKGDNGYLNPQSATNRAVCATIIERYMTRDFNLSEPGGVPTIPENQKKGQEVVEYARKFVGKTPYAAGGLSLETGTDCSGFVKLIYANFGITLPRPTWEQDDVGIEVKETEMQLGDLIFFANYEHVGIYSGNGKFIHTATQNKGTVEEELKWMGPIKTVRRVL